MRSPTTAPSPGDAGGERCPRPVSAAPGMAGQGRAYLFDGNVLGPHPVLGTLNDPAPVSGGPSGLRHPAWPRGVAVGAPWAHGSGRCASSIAPGAARSRRPSATRTGSPAPRFGASIATLGDANGDGFDDLAVGAPGFDHPAAANAGRVYILTSKGPAAAGAPEACVSTGGETTGGGGGGGGDGGGGDEATPPDDGRHVVIARVLRRLVLKSHRKRVRKDATIRLRGTLSASGNRSVCQRRQKIALQRRKASGGRFQTFEVALTRASGTFTARAIASAPTCTGPGSPRRHAAWVPSRRPPRSRSCASAVPADQRETPAKRGGDRALPPCFCQPENAVFADSPLVPSKCRDALGGGSI